MNQNRGFAISSMLYTVLLLFLVLLIGILGLLGTRKVMLDKMKNEILVGIGQGSDIQLSFLYRDVVIANTSQVDNFTFIPTDIVKVVDKDGNPLTGASISYDSKPNFDSTKNGTYTITYTGTYRDKTVNGTTTITVADPLKYTYEYTGSEQTFYTPTDGVYQIKLWGAQGGSYDTSHPGGKGAYTAGNIALERNQNLYIQVGGEGEGGNIYQGEGGYNGGGRAGYNAGGKASGGGGATDIRLVSGSWDNFNSLKSRIMVAAGGGGYVLATSHTNTAGAAGALTSESVTGTFATTDPTGATQTSPGQGKDTTKHGSFGAGGNSEPNVGGWGGGGGSGYYGGALGYGRGGTGGSSFISGHTGCNAIQEASTATAIKHSNQPNHYSGLVFTNTVMKSGKESLPDPYKTTNITGNNGDGHAIIIPLIVEQAIIGNNLVENSGFENGTERWGNTTANYFSLQTSGGISNSKCVKMVSIGANYKWIYSNAMSLPIGHKIYITAYYKKSGGGVSRYGIHSQPNNVSQALITVSNNQANWTKISNVYTNASTVNQGNFLVYGAGATDASDLVTHWDNIMALDLTEIYGAGNEPTKEWCDKNIPYFEGTWILPKR